MTIFRMRYGHFLCTPFLFIFFIRLFSGIGYLVGTSDASASVLISKGVLLSDCVVTLFFHNLLDTTLTSIVPRLFLLICKFFDAGVTVFLSRWD